MSYGKDERDFAKHIWQVPIPLFDPAVDLHVQLATRGAELESAIAEIQIEADRNFVATRRDIRAFIAKSEAGKDVEELVEELLN